MFLYSEHTLIEKNRLLQSFAGEIKENLVKIREGVFVGFCLCPHSGTLKNYTYLAKRKRRQRLLLIWETVGDQD